MLSASERAYQAFPRARVALLYARLANEQLLGISLVTR